MSDVDKYLNDLSGPNKELLEHVCNVIRKLVPDAKEVTSYGVPSFKYGKDLLVGFASYKNFASIYPTSGPIREYKKELSKYETSRGAIRFTVEHTIPDELLKKIVITRLNYIKDSRGLE